MSSPQKAEKPKLADLIKAADSRVSPTAGLRPGQPGRPKKPKNGNPVPKPRGTMNATQAANPEMRPLAERLLAVKFAREYIRNGFNGTEAVIATIPGKRTRAAAGVAAHKLVANPMVQEAMRRELRAIDSLNEVDMEYLIRSFRSIAEASVFDYGIKIVNGRGDFTDFNHELLTLDQKANLREITFHDNGAVKTIRLASRERALDALMDAKVRAEENATGAGMDTLKARLRAAQARIPLLPKNAEEPA
jgi:hypothetical protein